MEQISVFDILKIGVGPSSSHTLGPWRAALRFVEALRKKRVFDRTQRIAVDLYGSLSLTGKGHYTDTAVMMGLTGADPQTVPVEDIRPAVAAIALHNRIVLSGGREIEFHPSTDIRF